MSQQKLNEIRKKCERCVEFGGEYETVLELIDEVERLNKETARLRALGRSFRTAIFNHGLACPTCIHYFNDDGGMCSSDKRCTSYEHWRFDSERFGGEQ